MFLAIAISLFVIACSNDVEKSQEKPKKQFDKDLAEYVAKQKGFMRSVVISRSGNENITYDDILMIAAQLDSCSLEFYKENGDLLEILRQGQEEGISEEDLIIMSIDEDALLEFIEKTYSIPVRTYVSELLESSKEFDPFDKPQYIIQDGTLFEREDWNNLSETEKMVLANVEVAADFDKLVIDVMHPEGLEKEYQHKSQECIEKYTNDIENCNSKLVTGLVAVVAGKMFINPWEWLHTSVDILNVAQNYNECLLYARRSMDKCK